LLLNGGECTVILATHQPIFLPWPGFFYKAMCSDCIVLLDDVQYPRGRSWLNRNRLKSDDGELWLTAPVKKKGRGLQAIRRVELYDQLDWRKKHLRGIRQNYTNAPYFEDYIDGIESVYSRRHALLAQLNVELIRLFFSWVSIDTKLLLQSELGVGGGGTGLLTDICHHLGANRLLVFPHVEKHIDVPEMKRNGIELTRAHYRPPVYPQLWGPFIYNLSMLDLLMNCGPKSRDVVLRP
jgi:hypothetical protein